MNRADIERAVDTLQRNNPKLPEHPDWCPFMGIRQKLNELLARANEDLRARRHEIDRADINAWLDEAASIGVTAGQETRICETCARIVRGT